MEVTRYNCNEIIVTSYYFGNFTGNRVTFFLVIVM